MKLLTIVLGVTCSLMINRVFAQTNGVWEKYDSEVRNTSVWGSPTNGLRFGIRIVGGSSIDEIKVLSYLDNISSTNIYGLWQLPSGYYFEKLTLFNKSGTEIRKTSIGNGLCKTPLWSASGGHVLVIYANLPNQFAPMFDIKDCFAVKDAGEYTLIVKPQLYALKGYQNYVKLDIPEASVKLIITEGDLKR